ncbi:E3 ubiquitin-protein ligase TRIM58-like [Pelodytes ibericus]
MASAGLRDELICSICLNIYTDPVTLTCGHSYCLVCIGNVLDTQEGSGVYSCPECRAEFQDRPALEKNRKLGNIAETFLSTQPEEDRKCSVHKKVLEYYCTEDAVCICVSCSLAGEHRGHQVETLNEASEKKKEKLRNILEKLTSEREEAEKRVQSLQEPRREVQEKAAGVTERVTGLIRDIRDQLEALEKRVLSEISRQEEQVSHQVSDLIRQLEIKKEDLSRKMGHIEEELCNTTDPLTVLQGRESDSTGSCDAEEEDNEDRERDDKKVHAVGDLDMALISVTLHTGLDDIVTGVKRRVLADMLLDENMASDMLLDVNTASHMLLDENTAGNHVIVSSDLKTVSGSGIKQSRPVTPERFLFNQVLSIRSFSSGRHYWEVESSESGGWRIGTAYPSMDRRGWESLIGDNNKSWCLESWGDNQYVVVHDSEYIKLSPDPSCRRFGIYLDYEAGRLSFYELCDPIRFLHTFTACFTEPLHAVFGVYWKDSFLSVKG